ncbi:MAG TPA: hypothetical protein VD886_12815, partial [Herpetosiphonaceae bacterium]|nr:hypothetical protein [Herpetosiphonaceae bacterium]
PPDADDLGLLLRLFRFSGQQPAHRGLLAEPLRLFEEHMRPSGAIPVWLQAPERGAGAPFALWGDDCIAVQAQFLIGLLDYDAAGYAERIGRGAAYVCARVVEAGLGANRYYAPLYGLWAVSELVRRLGRTAGGAVAAARAALATRLDCAAAAAESPQDLALLILSASAQGRSGQPPTSGSPAAWADRLIAAQRYDGGWRDEPLYITGDRGGRAGWYSSRAFTTALCYHALKSLDYS